MPLQEESARQFDAWAAGYDDEVQREAGFPFVGYAQVLGEIVRLCAPQPGDLVVDMGTGTGELARLLVDEGCEVWGVDFSQKMLSEAEKKVPGARWVQADLAAGWPAGLPDNVHCVVSSYALHHFPLDEKVRLIALWSEHVGPGGAVIVGDISFSTAQERAAARRRWRELWDDEEFCWVAQEALPALHAAGLHTVYTQISICAGVLTVRARANPPGR